MSSAKKSPNGSNKWIPLSIPTLFDYLKNKEVDVQIQSETNQIYFVFKVETFEFPLFLRVYEESNLLQLIVFLPTPLTSGKESDLALLLHMLNKELDIPGFGMDEAAQVVYYRWMLPAVNKKIHGPLLERFLESIQMVCQAFSPVIFAVAQGMATYQDVLKKAQEEIKKQQEQHS